MIIEDIGLVWLRAWEDFAWATRCLEAACDMFGSDPGDLPGTLVTCLAQAIQSLPGDQNQVPGSVVWPAH